MYVTPCSDVIPEINSQLNVLYESGLKLDQPITPVKIDVKNQSGHYIYGHTGKSEEGYF